MVVSQWPGRFTSLAIPPVNRFAWDGGGYFCSERFRAGQQRPYSVRWVDRRQRGVVLT